MLPVAARGRRGCPAAEARAGRCRRRLPIPRTDARKPRQRSGPQPPAAAARWTTTRRPRRRRREARPGKKFGLDAPSTGHARTCVLAGPARPFVYACSNSPTARNLLEPRGTAQKNRNKRRTRGRAAHPSLRSDAAKKRARTTPTAQKSSKGCRGYSSRALFPPRPPRPTRGARKAPERVRRGARRRAGRRRAGAAHGRPGSPRRRRGM